MHRMGARETSLSQLASLQHGVVTRGDLASLGFGRRQIERRAADGRLVRVHRGVYAVGHAALSREGRWMAAVVACGERAVLSHRSAAVCWGCADREDLVPHVTAPHRLRPAGVVAHRGRLAPADMTMRDGIPVTSPARTLADLAQSLSEEALERVVRQAQFRRLFDPLAIRDALQRRPSALLRQLLDDLNPSQSELEDRFLRLCRRHGIPRPHAQVRDGRRRPDFVWPEARLIVEVDSWQAHGTQHAFQADRTLSNAVQLAGWTILRFTYADITRRDVRVAAQLRQALGLTPG
jgi:very-short-patch-repair endonuclease